ncbi:MAG: T9SS type A sorting domain-containing protein [Bacteroidales bacterium]|nr:T9SS type A sorting domain-containing protein [Bacteroidales bacterium]
MKKTTILQLFFVTFFYFSLAFRLLAQIPTTQDCRGAIPVCDFIYTEDSTASGFGNYFEIPNGGSGCPNNHCMDGEKNSRWYIFTVISSGNLKFQITPQVNSDDYDWAVFNLSSYHCEDIWGGANLIMSSCNAAGGSGYQGVTGISTFNGGNSNCSNGGPTNKWNKDLPVFEGETYVLVVSDWTQTPGGYTLDFSASSASIFDDQDPYIEYIGGDLITECGTNELLIQFSENVKCSSIQKQDFKLEGPGGPFVIDSLYGETCNLGGNNEKEYTLYVSPPFNQSGDYVLTIKNFAFIKDACDNYAQPEAYDFTIDLDSPDAVAGADIDVFFGETATLDGSASGGSGEFSYHWEPAEMLDNPDIPNPTTVAMSVSTAFVLEVTDTISTCVGQDTMWVNVLGAPLGITVAASTGLACEGDRVDLFTYPDGGSGDYTYIWTSNPPYFTSDAQNPSDFPSADVTYIVEVNDGFSTVKDSVSVVVNPRPLADAGPDQVINEGTTATLQGSASGGSGVFTYLWEPASELQQNDIPNPTTVPLYNQTVFSLFINDGNGCQSEPDQVVVNPEGDGLSASPLADPPEICIGQSTTVTAWASGGGGEFTYDWTSNPPGFASDQPQFTVSPNVSTIYELVLSDQFGNEVTASILVTVNSLPVIELDPSGQGKDSIRVCVRDSVLLDAGQDSDPDGTEYFWLTTNLVNRYYKAMTNGNWIDMQSHSVRVTNGATGCQNTGSITIVFDFTECQISVPENHYDLNAAIDLHPNPNQGDFMLTLNNDLENLRIIVLDTRGRIVYSESWSGKYASGYRKEIQPGIHKKGIYFIQLISGDLRVVKKMVVQ